jgi:hypothetical protein
VHSCRVRGLDHDVAQYKTKPLPAGLKRHPDFCECGGRQFCQRNNNLDLPIADCALNKVSVFHVTGKHDLDTVASEHRDAETLADTVRTGGAGPFSAN